MPKLDTPAFLYSEAEIRRQLNLLSTIRGSSNCRILYSIKALPFAGLLDLILPAVDGFSASSLFEARLASEALARGGRAGALHITTPGLRLGEMDELAGLCDAISFNSLEQFQRMQPTLEGRASAGIRVNPQLSFLDDRRYDPCRPFSKLGVPLSGLAAALNADAELRRQIEGIHFHTLFESRSFEPLRATLEKIDGALGHHLDGLRWINLGGGYLIESTEAAETLAGIVRDLRERRGVDVYFEPGKSVVGQAGTLVASVIDRFERDGKAIAVLDTGVHHLPEVFEYQKSPQVAGHHPGGRFEYLLVGCTCLAGDVFGECRFDQPLTVGDRVAFENVGAYALVKASRFNGYDLPTIYWQDTAGRISLMKRFGYEDYRRFWTADAPPVP
ncbi:carboxynorspermidine decarboxylase [Methylomagnum sp.]